MNTYNVLAAVVQIAQDRTRVQDTDSTHHILNFISISNRIKCHGAQIYHSPRPYRYLQNCHHLLGLRFSLDHAISPLTCYACYGASSDSRKGVGFRLVTAPAQTGAIRLLLLYSLSLLVTTLPSFQCFKVPCASSPPSSSAKSTVCVKESQTAAVRRS